MKKIFLLAVILMVIPTLFVMSILSNTGENKKAVWVHIQKGDTASSIAADLASKKLTRSAFEFKFMSYLFFMQDKFQAGSYKFSKYPKLLDVLLKIKRGETSPPDPLMLSFPEGTSIYKMGTVLRKNDVDCAKYYRGLTKTDLIEKYSEKFGFLRKIPTKSLEGYLYPDTYIFDKNVSGEVLAQLMLLRFNEVVVPYWETNKHKTEYNLHQIITLASIIEKEAATDEERSLVSSVFYNRMGLGMPLDSCATIKYALKRPSKKVYYDQLSVKSPYNTYINRGLPPGPICNPGIKSIQAAVEPTDTDYCYFVSKRDGTHIFSKTGKEHIRAKNLIEKGQLFPFDR